jgi:hypothetical protein
LRVTVHSMATTGRTTSWTGRRCGSSSATGSSGPSSTPRGQVRASGVDLCH